MRVLLTTNPLKTVFLHMVPLAWALRTAGHEVRFASQPSFADTITQAGLTAVPLGRDHTRLWSPAAGSAKEDAVAERVGIPEPYDAFDNPEKGTWDYLVPGIQGAIQRKHKLEAFPVISDLVDYARSWEPDLVLWDPLTYAGAIAAKASGAAHARLLFGIDIMGGVRQLFLRLKAEQPEDERTDPLAEWLGSYARKYGGEFTEDMAVGHFTIDQLPLSLQTEAEGLHYTRTQYIPYSGPAVVPNWMRTAPRRPRVVLSLGNTATTVYDGYAVDVQAILDNLADLDIEIVATIAESEQHKVTRVPENTRVVSYVPLHALIPTCDAVIHHGGAGTTGITARFGVPHLVLHDHYDQPILAEKLSTHGAGLGIHFTQATGPKVRENLLRLLHEPTFRRRAADLRTEIHAIPSPNEFVSQLEELATKYRNR